VPYNHSNLDSDEVLYYVEGNYKARRGIESGSLTLHPQGIPHGPHPGTVEATLGATFTNELAVMVDTFRPLYPTQAALDLDDLAYPMSWEEDPQVAAARLLADKARPNGSSNGHANGSANGTGNGHARTPKPAKAPSAKSKAKAGGKAKTAKPAKPGVRVGEAKAANTWD